jgi:hypothetical protein
MSLCATKKEVKTLKMGSLIKPGQQQATPSLLRQTQNKNIHGEKDRTKLPFPNPATGVGGKTKSLENVHQSLILNCSFNSHEWHQLPKKEQKPALWRELMVEDSVKSQPQTIQKTWADCGVCSEFRDIKMWKTCLGLQQKCYYFTLQMGRKRSRK